MKKLAVVIGLILMFAALPIVMAQGGTIELGQSVDGSLEDATATYQINLAEGQAISITLNSEDFDSYLEIQDKSGAQLATDDDSGGGYNSALVFSAPSAGVYKILVRAYDGNATGAYVLAVNEVTISMLTYGTPLAVEVNNDIHTFSFQGTAGDVLDISTDNPDADVRLRLTDPSGNEIASDDDGGPGYAALIRAVELPTAGTYTLQMEPVLDAVGTINVLVVTSQVTVLGPEPYVVTLGGDGISADRVAFEAVSGQNYRLTVSADVQASAYIQIEQGDFNWISLSFYNALESTLVFTSTTDGLVSIDISDSSSGGATYSISISALN